METAKRRNKPEEYLRERINDEELIQRVLDKIKEDWIIEEVDKVNNRVVMTKTKGGSLLQHIGVGALTGGLGNAHYEMRRRETNRKRKVLRSKQQNQNTNQTQDTSDNHPKQNKNR